MTAVSDQAASLATTAGVGAISVLGAIAKSAQWRDAQTGRVVWPLFFSGICTCLIMASVVRAGGVHFGVEPWVQVMLSGVFCYVGPDPILKMIAGLALKRIGLEDKPDGINAPKPGP